MYIKTFLTLFVSVLGVFLVTGIVKAYDDFGGYTVGALATQNNWQFIADGSGTILVTSTAECYPLLNTKCVYGNGGTGDQISKAIGSATTTSGAFDFAIKSDNSGTATAGLIYLGLRASSTAASFIDIRINYSSYINGIEIDIGDDFYDVWNINTEVWTVGTFYWFRDNRWSLALANTDNPNFIYTASGEYIGDEANVNPEWYYVASTGGAGSVTGYIDNIGAIGTEQLSDDWFEILETASTTGEIPINFTDAPFIRVLWPVMKAHAPFNYVTGVFEAFLGATSTKATTSIILTTPSSTNGVMPSMSFVLLSEDTFNRFLGDSNILLIRNVMIAMLWLGFVFYIYKRSIKIF